MANNALLIEERSRDIGQFLVGRLLPFREKRMVGPFCFIDHMGPVTLVEGDYFDVDQHPHIGLCTLTYLLDGTILHEDSTGARQLVTPGSVNLMVSGSGVTHTERTPEDFRKSMAPQHLHGYQVWIALPKEMEETSPAFHHVPVDALPAWTVESLHMRLVAGTAFGRTSPVPIFSPLFMLDVSNVGGAFSLEVNNGLSGEIAVVVVSGSVTVGDQEVLPGQMLVSKVPDECSITLEAASRVLLFGGQPLPEERFMYWNFVSSDKSRLEKAKEDWKARRFPQVPGDATYIPMP